MHSSKGAMRIEHLPKVFKHLGVSICILVLLTTCIEDIGKADSGLPPEVIFSASPTQAEVNQLIQFTDQSTNNPTSWIWTFGDGPGKSTQHPSVVYTVPGWYTISLSATNIYGSDTKTVFNYIKVGQLDSIKDYEGNAYLTVKIGNQWWMAENLKSTVFNDGTPIPQVTDSAFWSALSTPAYCWYNNDISNKNIYGTLYNWFAVNSAKLAPIGWHVPSDDDFKQLEMTLGMTLAQVDSTYFRGTDQGVKIKKKSGWPEYTNGTNTSGFSAIPGGYRIPQGSFIGQGHLAGWWSSSLQEGVFPWCRNVFSNPGDIVARYGYIKTAGFSVRCVKD